MSRAPANFRQSDLERAIRAAEKGGLTSYEIVIDGARVIIRVPGHPLAPDKPVADDEEIVL
jgi:hypothetical protein